MKARPETQRKMKTTSKRNTKREATAPMPEGHLPIHPHPVFSRGGTRDGRSFLQAGPRARRGSEGGRTPPKGGQTQGGEEKEIGRAPSGCR